ncbi:hypothetical protein BJ944DRAFT_261207, partial [Cunninghamella echinulata]
MDKLLINRKGSTTQFLPLPLYGTSKSLIQHSSSTPIVGNNDNNPSKFNVGKSTLKRLPYFQLYSNSKRQRIVDKPSEITIDIQKFQQEYQQALELKNDVIQPSASNSNSIITGATNISIDMDLNNTFHDNVHINTNDISNRTEEAEPYNDDNILNDILSETDYTTHNRVFIPTKSSHSHTTPELHNNNNNNNSTFDVDDMRSSTISDQQINNVEEEYLQKCLTNMLNLPEHVVPVFPTSLQVDAIQDDLRDLINNNGMSTSEYEIKKHLIKTIDTLNHPVIPLIKGYETASNESWKGSGKTAFIEQLALCLEKEYDVFHLAVVCYELTMEEQLITLFEERYTVQRISMVMDDKWDYDYGIVAKIQKPLENTSTQRSLLPKDVDLVIVIDPRNQVENEALKAFQTTNGCPPYLHLVSVNCIEQRLRPCIKDKDLKQLELPENTSYAQFLDTSNDFALPNPTRLTLQLVNSIIKWLKHPKSAPYHCKIKNSPNISNDNNNNNIVIKVSNNNNNNNVQQQITQSSSNVQPVIEKIIIQDNHRIEVQTISEPPPLSQQITSETRSLEGDYVIEHTIQKQQSNYVINNVNNSQVHGQGKEVEAEVTNGKTGHILSLPREEEEEIIEIIDEWDAETQTIDTPPLIVPSFHPLPATSENMEPSNTSTPIGFEELLNSDMEADGTPFSEAEDGEMLNLQAELEKFFTNTSVNRLKKEVKSLSNMISINTTN